MAEFHFIRPLWLLLLPILLWAAWRQATGKGGQGGWRSVVDKALQPFVLRDGETVGQRRWPLFAALASAVLGVLALAGPTWERQPVPAFRSDESLVIALDLSRSMDATDVAPTRLTRARIKLLDLLARREGGQTALVVFSSHSFTVTPLTSDTRTIASLVNALSTDIMPSQGSLVEVGLEKSAELLRQTGAVRGEILLLTDAIASPESFRLAESLRDDGIRTSVLAVGTEEGAPIPEIGGGFVTDGRGEVVVPQLNLNNLERLAAAGGGRFARLQADDSDLDRLFPGELAGGIAIGDAESEREADVWRDQGIWLALALLPVLALGFRRGWVYVLVVGLMLPHAEVQAFEWADLWLTRDQQGMRAMQREAHDAAAELFDDPEWLAAARYRAGQFDSSAQALAAIDSPDAHYNRGNALARGGQLAEAIEAYDRALELDPDHADAKFNRDLVADLLEDQPEQQNDQSQQDQSNNPETQDGEQDQGQQAPEQQGESAGQPELADDQDSESGSDQQAADNPNQQQQEDGQNEQQDEEGEQGESLQAAASPEEIEDWADEQAADQWLRRIPQDPGGLLRRKFLYQYQQQGFDQDGNRIFPGSDSEPW